MFAKLPEMLKSNPLRSVKFACTTPQITMVMLTKLSGMLKIHNIFISNTSTFIVLPSNEIRKKWLYIPATILLNLITSSLLGATFLAIGIPLPSKGISNETGLATAF